MVAEALQTSLLRWIPAVPLAVALLHAVLLGVLRRPLGRTAVVTLSCGAPLVSFVLACAAFARLVTLPEPPAGVAAGTALYDVVYTWIGAGLGRGAFSADVAFQLDPLSVVFALVATAVGSAIHLHAVDELARDERDDRGLQRFFACMNWTLGSMLVLVLADNLILLFAGWQGVTLGSWLLTGFWYADARNAQAGVRAFVANRVGELGLLVGALLLFWSLSEAGTPTLTFRGIEATFPQIAGRTLLPDAEGGLRLSDVIAGCFLLAAIARSGQLPLQFWLRDAIAAPPPASALVQGATAAMAGIYLVGRLSVVFVDAPAAMAAAAWIGGATAVLMALAAASQRDLLAVLACSTASQLGLGFVAVGSGAFGAGVFQIVAHAFVKSLLFLGAATVIVAMRGERDMRRMGALRKRLPKTRFLVGIGGVLVLAGFPASAGFFSTGEVLVAVHRAALPGEGFVSWCVVATAFLTSFYILRCHLLVFEGDSRVEREVRAHMHEPGNAALAPIYALVLLSVFASLLGFPQLWGDQIGLEDSNSLAGFLAPVLHAAPIDRAAYAVDAVAWGMVWASVAAFALGAAAAWALYLRWPAVRERMSASVATLASWVRDGYRADELVEGAVVAPLFELSDRVLHRGVERGLVDAIAVEGTARAVRAFARDGLQKLHSGMVQGYLVVVVGGMLGILLFLVR